MEKMSQCKSFVNTRSFLSEFATNHHTILSKFYFINEIFQLLPIVNFVSLRNNKPTQNVSNNSILFKFSFWNNKYIIDGNQVP